MKIFAFKRIAIIVCSTLCLSVVSCSDATVSLDTEYTENDISQFTTKEQEATTGISEKTETITGDQQFETKTTENSIHTEEIIAGIDSQTTHDVFEETILDDENLDEIIDRNLDILMEDSESFYSEREFIDAHPKAFTEIVEIGEEALPYLDIIINNFPIHLQYNHDNYRGLLAMAAAYMIQPDLYDLEVKSPDGKYTLKAVVSSFDKIWDPFIGIEYNLHVIDNETESILISSDQVYSFPSALFKTGFESGIHWSEDSRYIIIEQKYRHYPHIIHVIDVFETEYIQMPSEDDIQKLSGTTLNYYSKELDLIFDCLAFDFKQLQKNLLEIDVSLVSEYGGGYTIGSYVYDLDQHEIIDLSISLP